MCYICLFLVIILLLSTAYILFILRIERQKYKQLLKEGKNIHESLRCRYELKLKKIMEEDKQRQLREAASMTHHLSNVISGMNHEISPWIGGIKNKISRLSIKSKSSVISLSEVAIKLNDVIKACDSMSIILDNLSRDVKKVQKYDTFKSNILETIKSWVRLTITDRSIKENLSSENFLIDDETLNFSCHHSPLLVSQVILNLVKNSIDHNNNILDSLKIKIRGDVETKSLIYEDNGKGIPVERLESIFMPGMTTKEHDKELHGIGLSLCQDYCATMGAVLIAEKSNIGAKFVIYFESDKTKSYTSSKIHKIKKMRESSILAACKIDGERRLDDRN